ncbi:MAG: PDZ domain-containing protein [Chthonomonadales bacterium]|nr:PDZ domain-containing protein [Chthonomonadales bacterium]
MTRSLRYTILCLWLGLVVCASFAGGRHIRRIADATIVSPSRFTALPAAAIGASDYRPSADDDSAIDPSETFRDVLRYVRTEYVDRVTDDGKLSAGAVKTMLMSLDDPRTRFLDPSQRERLEAQVNGKFTGIGAVLTVVKRKRNAIEQRRLAVVAPVPGGPADKAGLRAGDVITEIGGRWVIAYDPRLDLDQLRVRDMDEQSYRNAFKQATQRLTDGVTLPKALDTLATNAEKPLEITVERAGSEKPLKLTVLPAGVEVVPVEYRTLPRGGAYLRVTQFGDRATREFTQALSGGSPRALVVDLRDNVGGPVTGARAGVYGSALQLLSRLTPGGSVGAVVRKGDRKQAVTVETEGARHPKLAVLVNSGTANIAEWVAAALRDRGGAVIVGARTFGDATLQKLVPLGGGSAMTLTTGKLLTARGVDFAGTGIKPDRAVATGGPRADDPVVTQALGWLARA